MKTKGILLPDEWLSAISAGGDLLSVSKGTANGIFKLITSVVLPFFFGSSAFYCFDYYIADLSSKIGADALKSVVTVVAILAGFMITTILFTGRPNGLSSLNSHELRAVREKISYLVLSQCITLACHIACALFSLCLIAFYGKSLSIPSWSSFLLAGFVALSVTRSAVLPLQIWEVHAFSIDVEISEKIKSEEKLVSGEE